MAEASPLANGAAPRLSRLRALWPDVKALVGPRRRVLALGMVLIGVSRVAALIAPAATKLLIDEVLGAHRVALLPWIVGGVALATLVQAATSYTLTQMFTRSTTRFVTELRCKLHAHLLRLPLAYHDAERSGALAARIMNDVVGVQGLVGTALLGFLGTLLTAGVALALVVRWSPLLAVAAVACSAGAGALAAVQARRAKAISLERFDIFADIQGRLVEALGGVRILKTYRAEAREETIFLAGLERLVANTLKGTTLGARAGFASTVLWGLVNAVMMFIGARKIVAGALTLGEAVTIMALFQYVAAPFLQLAGIGTMLVEALAGLERTRRILGERPEDRDPRRTVALGAEGALRGEVRFDHVSFAYTPDAPVLHDVSFRADPGTVTALVGPSGAGKSTITGLVAALYAPTGGEIFVDGEDLGTVRLDGYRSRLGVVLQETFLFAGSILDNIAFARPGATRDEILAAARSARVDEFAEAFAQGYDTKVGERGVRLSGGQRQRISIARALLADPRILILDEATSSLDSTSEALIQEALARLFAGRTTFVIAHRLSTIRRADQILVVDAGRIVQRGTHASLLTQDGLYAEMYRRQHNAEADLFLAPGEGTAAGPAPAARGALIDVEAAEIFPPPAAP